MLRFSVLARSDLGRNIEENILHFKVISGNTTVFNFLVLN